MAAPDVRHRWPDRLFHWTMAALVAAELATAFLPVLGVAFNWVPIHWMAGVALVGALLFHLYRAAFVHGLSAMLPAKGDLRAALGEVPASGKYDLGQKLYHWSVAAVLLALAATGLAMLARIDTPFWDRDPALLSDRAWGLVYVLHGAAAMALIFFLVLHLYFAFLPEHRRLLAAMALGGPGPERGR